MKRTLVVTFEFDCDERAIRDVEDVVDRLLDAGAIQGLVAEDLIDHGGREVRFVSSTCHEPLGLHVQSAAEAIREVLTVPQLALLTKLGESLQLSPIGRLRGPWMRVANTLVSHKVAEHDIDLSARLRSARSASRSWADS